MMVKPQNSLFRLGRFVLNNINDTKLYKFIIVGLLNTLVGYGIYAILIFLGVHFTIASFLGTILGVLFNYFSTGLLVFERGRGRLVQFVMVYIIIYLCNILGIQILNMVGFNLYYSGALLVPPSAAFSFILNKYWVFKEAKDDLN